MLLCEFVRDLSGLLLRFDLGLRSSETRPEVPIESSVNCMPIPTPEMDFRPTTYPRTACASVPLYGIGMNRSP